MSLPHFLDGSERVVNQPATEQVLYLAEGDLAVEFGEDAVVVVRGKSALDVVQRLADLLERVKLQGFREGRRVVLCQRWPRREFDLSDEMQQPDGITEIGQ